MVDDEEDGLAGQVDRHGVRALVTDGAQVDFLVQIPQDPDTSESPG